MIFTLIGPVTDMAGWGAGGASRSRPALAAWNKQTSPAVSFWKIELYSKRSETVPSF